MPRNHDVLVWAGVTSECLMDAIAQPVVLILRLDTVRDTCEALLGRSGSRGVFQFTSNGMRSYERQDSLVALLKKLVSGRPFFRSNRVLKEIK